MNTLNIRENIPFERLFNPRAIAVIGAGKESFGGGGYFINCMSSAKFPNPIYPVNPKYEGKEETTFGYKIYGSIQSLPADPPIDLAIIAVPARITPKIIEELGQINVPFAHIFSSGYSEVGNSDLENELLKKSREGNVRIVGPNCLGIYNPKAKVSFVPGGSVTPGPVAFISQSGGLGGRLIRYGPGAGFNLSKVVSLGNQIDLDLIDFLRYFKDDPETKVIAMYIENLKREGNKFVQLLKETTLKKPVIIWKAGFSETGNSAVMSHTGGLAGNYKLWQAMAKQTGALLVENFDQLTDQILTFLTYNPPKTKGTAIISAGGGLAVEATDACERAGVNVPRLSASAIEKMKQFIPGVNTNITNPLDLGASGFDINKIIKSINVLAEDEDQISSVMLINAPELFIRFSFQLKNATTSEEAKELEDPFGALKLMIDELTGSIKDSKILMSVTAKQYNNKEALMIRHDYVTMLRERGIMTYESVEDAARCLLKIWTYGNYLETRNIR